MEHIATSKNFKTLARMGYGARGVVYLMIGGLALLTAFGEGGKTTDSRGAITEIMQQPFGEILLTILIVGLLGYVVWRFTQAVKDADGHGNDPKGLAVRSGLFISAISHLFLAFWATMLLLGEESSSDASGGGMQENGQAFLQTDIGQMVLGIVGLIVIGVGFAHMYKGWQSRFERYMDIPGNQQQWARPVCRFGLIARGIVWCIVGWFLARSALLAGSGDIKGIAEALDTLRNTTYGIWLFSIVAAGLVAFGVYSVLEALYRRINTD
jgi:hypothetical protein